MSCPLPISSTAVNLAAGRSHTVFCLLVICGVACGQRLLAESVQGLGQPASRPPNIVLILADDMGPGEPSHAGGLIPTPAIDRLATEGMRFTDAHTGSSVCTPTRYGILTGRHCWRSRLKRGVLVRPGSPALMDPNRVSMPRFLQQAGYHTAIIGKWHLGADWQPAPKKAADADPSKPAQKRADRHGSWAVDYARPFRNGPIDVGFDEAFFILSSLDMPPYVYLQQDRAVELPTVDRGFPHNEYNDYQRIGAATETFDPSTCLAEWAARSRTYIKQRCQQAPDQPFFLYLPLTSPHTPIRPGAKFKGKYPQYSSYADFVAETDWVVGQVLEQLDESQIANDTLVIYTSDNGFAAYVKIPKMIAAGYRPSGPYRGVKAMLYEGGHRVPFLVRLPGKVSAGAVCDTTICTTDFFATFAELVGKQDAIKPDMAEDSFSFMPCLRGEQAATRPYTIHHSIAGRFAIRKGPWKLLLTRHSNSNWELPWSAVKTDAKHVQLYNLDDDPGETRNLETQHPEKVNELLNDLVTAMRNGRTTAGQPQSNEGWPFQEKATIKAFPQLGGP